MFVLSSLAGTILSPAFFAFHLLQIVENNQLLKRVIRAVTVNGCKWLGNRVTMLIVQAFPCSGFASSA